MKGKIHDLNHDLTFSAHTINFVCHSIRSMFKVLDLLATQWAMFSLITKPNKAWRLEIAGTDDKLGKKKKKTEKWQEKARLDLRLFLGKIRKQYLVNRTKIFSQKASSFHPCALHFRCLCIYNNIRILSHGFRQKYIRLR